jgi:hypothetical protein
MTEILSKCGYAEMPLPERFQILFAVEINQEEHAMGEAHYLTHRP